MHVSVIKALRAQRHGAPPPRRDARPRAVLLRSLGGAVVALAAFVAAAVPAGGQSAPGFVAVDAADGDYGTIPPRWAGPNGASAMSIPTGGTISFSYPSGAS